MEACLNDPIGHDAIFTCGTLKTYYLQRWLVIFTCRARTKINEFRQILNYVARMRGPQPVKLALDLTRNNTPRCFSN